MKHRFNKSDTRIIKDDQIYAGFLKFHHVTYKHRLFAGGWSDNLVRDLVRRRRAACVLLYDPLREKIVLVEQCRLGAIDDEMSPWLLELVAGIMEDGDSPESLCYREAQEEAGCTITKLIPITACYSSPGASSEFVYIFCGHVDSEGVAGIHGLAHEHEDILVHVLSLDEAYSALQQGHIRDAKTIIALQWLQLTAS